MGHVQIARRHERTIAVISTNRRASGTRRLGAAAVAGLLALTGLAALTNSAAGAPSARSAAPAAAAAAKGKDWTFMVYDVADTSNIANDMIVNLAQFADVAEMDDVNVVALVDLPERTDPGYPDATLPGIAPFTTTKLLELDNGRWNEVADLGEVSMGRPDTLARFIEQVADSYPASKYGLVLSDHGGAWSGGYVDTGPPATSQLTIADMRAGIVTGMQRGGIDKFEFIDHDSCLMSSYEAASALAPLADVLVGSEEVTFGDSTLDVEAFSSLDDGISGEEWGRANIEGYAATADRYDGIGDFSALAVVDGEAMERLDEAIESFSDVAVDNMETIAPEIARARSRSLEFVTGLLGEEEGGGFSVVDLGDFLRQLKDVPDEVLVARDAVFAALDAAVLHQVTRKATQQATGLNVFFPETPRMARGYADSNIAPPGWDRLVESYADFAQESGGGSDGGASFTSEQADVVEIGPGGIRIAAQLESGDEKNVASQETQIYTRIDGKDVLAAALPAYLNSGGRGQVQGVWNFSLTTLQAGKKRAPASAVYQAQSGGLLGWFQALYTAPNGNRTDVEIQVLLSSEGDIESISVADISQGAQAGIELENGGRLTPYLIVPSSGGFQLELSSKSVPVNDQLEVAYPKLAKGTSFDMGVGVADLAGNFDIAFVTETVR